MRKSLYLLLLALLFSSSAYASKEESFTFHPISTIRLDYLNINNNKTTAKDRFFFRDAVIGGKGKIFYDLKYKIEANFSSSVHDRIQQGYVEYAKLDPYILKVGRFFPSFFLDYDRSFNEWPVAGALVVQLKDGIQFRTYGDRWTFSSSYGNSGSISKTQSQNKRDAFYLKGTYVPYYNKDLNEYFHIGLSNSYLKPKDYLQYKAKPEVRSNFNLLKTSKIYNVNYGNITNISLAYNYKSFSTQMEYLMSRLNRDSSDPNLLYHGGYIQFAYFMTGETKGYNFKKGKMEAITPNDPVFEFGKENKKIGKGAWEIATKYSTINLNSKIKSGKVDIYGVGVNWYLNDTLKLSNDFLIAKTDNNALVPNSTSKVALFRLQFDL
ncbi:MAG: porin [Rickettsiales bacterium]